MKALIKLNTKNNRLTSIVSICVVVCRAAFQYGVKMSDGRRTRRTGPKDEKSKLDRELQQINNIIKKRKVVGYEHGGKQPRY